MLQHKPDGSRIAFTPTANSSPASAKRRASRYLATRQRERRTASRLAICLACGGLACLILAGLSHSDSHASAAFAVGGLTLLCYAAIGALLSSD